MPELPEVETIARTLAPAVTGRSIAGVEVLNSGTWQGALAPTSILGHKISATGRRGKLLLIYFDQTSGHDTTIPNGLAVHLKMSGRLLVCPQETAPGPYTRVIITLDNTSHIFFDDTRKFGYMRAINQEVLASWSFWQKLGPEPLALAPAAFASLFRHRSGAIKALLLNQSILAGIGNIYADESLFRAGIKPTNPGNRLDEVRLRKLCLEMQGVLRESIAACGSSIRDYRTAQGNAGAFQNTFRVYGRAGKPCTVCGTPLLQTRIAGRSTVFCPYCQT